MSKRVRNRELMGLERELLARAKPQDDNVLILSADSFFETSGLTPGGYACLKEQGRYMDPTRDVVIVIPEARQDGFLDTLKGYAMGEIVSIRKEERLILKLSLLLLIVGVFFIAMSYVFSHTRFAQEVLVVASWVFLWMAVDKFCFERTGLRFKRLKLLQIVGAKIIHSAKRDR